MLRPTVRTHRHRYRGEVWHVVEDTLAQQFERLNTSAYRFVALLDGRRTVTQAWEACVEQLKDAAPTQGEAIALLSRLHASGLLTGLGETDVTPADLRRSKRTRREWRGRVGSLLFVRVPICNPDAALEAMVPLVRPFFNPLGALLWCALVAGGVWATLGAWDRLGERFDTLLVGGNLLLLYAVFAVTKLAHEAGHGLVLKLLARKRGGAGVHTLGLLFVAFLPIPYIDASAAWALPNKWHRVLVAMGGIIVEVAIAAACAIVWSQTASDSLLHAVAYNVMVVSGVATVVFNLNPLMRYDGYHALSDALETPNLASRATAQYAYAFQRYLFGVRSGFAPAHSAGEATLFTLYAPAALAYRVFVMLAIGWYILGERFLLGGLLLAGGLAVMLVLPVGKCVSYLLRDPALHTRRGRAMLVSGGLVAALFVPLVVIPVPEHVRIDGVLEPERFTRVITRSDGVLSTITTPGTQLHEGATILRVEHPSRASEAAALRAEIDRLRSRARAATGTDDSLRIAAEDRSRVLTDRLAWIEERIADETVLAEHAGTWVTPEVLPARGAWVPAGSEIGAVGAGPAVVLRAPLSQAEAGLLAAAAQSSTVSVRVPGAAHINLGAEFVGITAEESVPRPAGAETPAFTAEVRVARDPGLRIGQRAIARIRTGQNPLAIQWWNALRRTFQARTSG